MKKRHIFDVLWTVLGAVSARFGSLVLSVWVARETGKDNFALVGIYYATAMLGLVFFNAGVSNLTTKYLAEYLLKEPSKIKSILSATYLGCIFGGVVFSTGIALIAYFFSDKLFTSDRALFAMYFAAAAIFFMAVISGQSAILSGYGNFNLISQINIYSTIASFFFVIVGGKLFGIFGVMFGLVASQVVQMLIGIYFVRVVVVSSGDKWCLHDAVPAIGLLLTNALPTVASSFAVSFVNWLVMVWIERRSGLSELAVYNIANQWRAAMLFLPVTLGPLLIAKIASANARGTNIFFLIRRVLPATFFVGSLVYAVIFFSANYILMMYGDNFYGGGEIFLLITFSAVVISINNVLSKFMISAGYIKGVVLMDGIWAAVFLVTVAILIDEWSIFGVAWAAIGAAVVQLVAQIVTFKYYEVKRS